MIAEARLLHRYSGAPANRLVVSGQQFVADLKEGITTKTDTITAFTLMFRNGVVALGRGIGQVVPIAVDAVHGFENKYTLEDRTNQPYAGISNAVAKVRHNLHEGNYITAATNVIAEGPDGLIDDAAHALIGAPNNVIRPVEGPSYHIAA